METFRNDGIDRRAPSERPEPPPTLPAKVKKGKARKTFEFEEIFSQNYIEELFSRC